VFFIEADSWTFGIVNVMVVNVTGSFAVLAPFTMNP